MSLAAKPGGLTPLIPPVRRNLAANHALHPDRPWIRVLRVLTGLAVLAAVVQKTVDATLPGNDVDIAQLYSEFTVQGNLAFGLVLMISGVRRRGSLPYWWDHFFGGLVLYLVMTGIIYVVLVAPPGEPWWTWDLYWPQLVHHRLAPLVAALDWVLVTRTVRGPWWRPAAWLGYPVVFLAFSWIRGGLDGWYVYDFLDPTIDGGWPRVLATTGQVLAAFLAVAVLVHSAGNARAALAAGKAVRARVPRSSPSF
ncbi:Pr6Pr family membrane protein [Arthrobacter sp. FW306-07-I]|uniref:Pr6Pr family membrane protein n=1 Tax=Arthrobacter sp. FW306-07-I TaxID=2879622 RepID=UPI001F010BFB|nr:Pr6Pr family membrane protein [Arthrobacter sp. FW306-07-I]UKA74263.1 Pr6Pr family membrane protein [Arthrobacter sp. FW306-07-I]